MYTIYCYVYDINKQIFQRKYRIQHDFSNLNKAIKMIFFWKEEFYSDKNSTKKYSIGIIDMIKLRNIYNT